MAQLFDVEGARKAGWNDLEIAQYLQQTGRPAADRQQILATRPAAAFSFATNATDRPDYSNHKDRNLPDYDGEQS